MTEPAQRPKRPPVLIAALVALPLAALLFGMTATNLDGPRGSSASLPSVAVLISLLAIRFNWARVTSVAVLALLTPSNQYYRQAADWRTSQKRQPT